MKMAHRIALAALCAESPVDEILIRAPRRHLRGGWASRAIMNARVRDETREWLRFGNRIHRNRIEFDVRGYSHGFYRRGQHSAGLLMYEQRSHDVVAFNSVTHGRTGLGGNARVSRCGNDISGRHSPCRRNTVPLQL